MITISAPSRKWKKRKEKKVDKLWTLFFLDKTIDYTGRKERKRMSITKSVWWIGSYSSIYWDLQIMRDVKPMFQSLTNPIFKAMWRSALGQWPWVWGSNGLSRWVCCCAFKRSARTKLSEDHDSGKLKSTHIHDVAGRNRIFSRHV
jgi:hypothetical protein